MMLHKTVESCESIINKRQGEFAKYISNVGTVTKQNAKSLLTKRVLKKDDMVDMFFGSSDGNPRVLSLQIEVINQFNIFRV